MGSELFPGYSLTNGWQKHFKQLAEPTNNIYSNYDMEHLKIMWAGLWIHYNFEATYPAKENLKTGNPWSYQSLKQRKIRGFTWTISRKYCIRRPDLIYFLHILVNHIFLKGLIPAVIKFGLMSPVYKNNREKHDTKNYRGIVVLPC